MKVEIYEVGPRDGFQNVKEYIPVEQKLEIIDGLIQAGMKHVQITSFVSPKAIPQMKDAAEVAKTCVKKYPHVDFLALVPNLRGAQNAREAGLNSISYVVSLSLSHNQANIRRTHEQSFEAFKQIRDTYPDMDICLDLATAFGCPFEGMKYAGEVVPFIKDYVDAGVKTVNLCDTVGMANPAQVRQTIDAVREAYPEVDLMVHVHDTRGMGMACTLAAVEKGVSRVQSTLGGLGGCPFAPGASGNLATEDMAYMLSEMGYETGLDIPEMIKLAKYQAEKVVPNGNFSGHLYTINT